MCPPDKSFDFGNRRTAFFHIEMSERRGKCQRIRTRLMTSHVFSWFAHLLPTLSILVISLGFPCLFFGPKMPVDSELSDPTEYKESINTGQNSEVDWAVAVTEILHYRDEPGWGWSQQLMAAIPEKKEILKIHNIRRGRIWKNYKFGSLEAW